MGKFVYESIDELLEAKSGKAKKAVQSKKDDIKEKIAGLQVQLKDAKGPGTLKGTKAQKDLKIKEIQAKIDKFKAKLNEGYEYAGAEEDEEDYDGGMHIDSPNYWEAVANAMGGELVSFDVDHDEEKRYITISLHDGREVEILHDWREDGSESKPWTFINGDDRYGRLAIWTGDDSTAGNPGPEAYAEDIMGII